MHLRKWGQFAEMGSELTIDTQFRCQRSDVRCQRNPGAPAPDIIAAEIVEDLQAILKAETLKTNERDSFG
jgi:hypothetical protein